MLNKPHTVYKFLSFCHEASEGEGSYKEMLVLIAFGFNISSSLASYKVSSQFEYSKISMIDRHMMCFYLKYIKAVSYTHLRAHET